MVFYFELFKKFLELFCFPFASHSPMIFPINFKIQEFFILMYNQPVWPVGRPRALPFLPSSWFSLPDVSTLAQGFFKSDNPHEAGVREM